MAAGIGGVGTPNPRYLGSPIGWPGPAGPASGFRGARFGTSEPGLGAKPGGAPGVWDAAAGATGAPVRADGQPLQRPERLECRGSFCGPRKRERAGATPSHWPPSLQITRSRAAGSAARQRRRGGRSGDHPGRATPKPGSPAGQGRPATSEPGDPGALQAGPGQEKSRVCVYLLARQSSFHSSWTPSPAPPPP